MTEAIDTARQRLITRVFAQGSDRDLLSRLSRRRASARTPRR
jgi:hypothetical protein